jgi:hypothetical protein
MSQELVNINHPERQIVRPEIEQQELPAEWVQAPETPKGTEYLVTISSEEIGKLDGSMFVPSDGSPRSLYVDMFAAAEQGKGNGKRLLEKFKQEGLRFGATQMGGHFTSPEALGAFLGVVDRDNVTFLSRLTKQQCDITADEAFERPQDYIVFASLPHEK